jgi:hypothetical protein
LFHQEITVTELNTPQGQDSTKNDAQHTQESAQPRSGSTDTQEATKTYHCHTQPYHATQSRWGKIVGNIDWSQVILDILLIIIGIRLACIYSGQLQQMIQSNRLIEQTMRLDKRAWIGIAPNISVKNLAIKKNSLIGIPSIFVSNFGKTPAFSILPDASFETDTNKVDERSERSCDLIWPSLESSQPSR